MFILKGLTLEEREAYHNKRRRKNITLEDVAKSIGKSVSLISKYEKGYANLKHEQAYIDYIDTFEKYKEIIVKL